MDYELAEPFLGPIPEAAPPTLKERMRPMLRSVLGGTMAGLIMIVIAMSASAVVFHALPAHVTHGAMLFAFASSITPALLLMTGSEVVAPYTADAFVCALFAQSAASLSTRGDAAPFTTLVVAMAMTSFLLGAVFASLGLFRVGRIVQFVPSPVMSGFLGSMGWVQLDATCRITTGCPAIDWGCLTKLEQPQHSASQLMIALLVGLALFLLQGYAATRPALQQLVVPSTIIIMTVLFQAAHLVVPAAALAEWTIRLPGDQSLHALLSLPSLMADEIENVRWTAALEQACTVAMSAVLPCVMTRLLAYSAHEQRIGGVLDMSAELKRLGLVQMFASPVAMTPMFSLPAMSMAHSMGASGRIVPATASLLSLLVASGGLPLVTLMPKALFASMLASLGFSFLVTEMTVSWSSLTRGEYALVIVHVILAAYISFAFSLGFGLVACIIIFALDYGQYSGVLQTATAELERSNVVRPQSEHVTLTAHGPSTFILHLRGVLFFGSAAPIDDAIRAHMRAIHHQPQPLRLRFIVLDFNQCEALDSSAASVLILLRRHTPDHATFLYAAPNSDVLAMLRKRTCIGEGASTSKRDTLLTFDTLDLALEHAESAVLSEACSTAGATSLARSPRLPKRDDAAAVRVAPSAYEPPVMSASVAMATAAAAPSDEAAIIPNPHAAVTAATPPPPSSSLSSVSSQQPPLAPTAAPLAIPRRHRLPATLTGERALLPTSPSADAIIVYSYREACTSLRPGTERIRQRFEESVEGQHGVPQLAAHLLELMDIMVVPPGAMIFNHASASASLPASTPALPSLYFVDSGYVSVSMHLPHTAANAAPHAHGDRKRTISYRLKKVSTGAILGANVFVRREGAHFSGRYIPLPTSGHAATFCQILRLSSSALATLESTRPHIACRLYKLLCIVSQAAEREHVLGDAAFRAFGVKVQCVRRCPPRP